MPGQLSESSSGGSLQLLARQDSTGHASVDFLPLKGVGGSAGYGGEKPWARLPTGHSYKRLLDAEECGPRALGRKSAMLTVRRTGTSGGANCAHKECTPR